MIHQKNGPLGLLAPSSMLLQFRGQISSLIQIVVRVRFAFEPQSLKLPNLTVMVNLDSYASQIHQALR